MLYLLLNGCGRFAIYMGFSIVEKQLFEDDAVQYIANTAFAPVAGCSERHRGLTNRFRD